MAITKIKTLLAVELYVLTGDEIGKLKSKYLNKDYFDNKVLPEYCINDNGNVMDSYYYLQYVEEGDQKYHLFNAETSDKHLDYEISQGGLESLLENIDLSQMFDKLNNITSFEDFNRSIPITEYIIIELQYLSSFNGEFTESDMDVDVIGFLNNNLEIIEYEKEK